MYDIETNAQRLVRIKVQMKAIRLAGRLLQEQGDMRDAEGNSAWQQLMDELQVLKHEYRYLTFEENHGSLAAEMVVGDLEEVVK